jgi:sodium pump decarboxylase gamma subunit
MLSQGSDIASGLFLMFIGMGIVFLFLVIMVTVMYISANLIKKFNKYFPEKEEVMDSGLTKAIDNHEDIAVAIAVVKSYSN